MSAVKESLLPVGAETQCLRVSLGRRMYTTVRKFGNMSYVWKPSEKRQPVGLSTPRCVISYFLVAVLGNGRNH